MHAGGGGEPSTVRRAGRAGVPEKGECRRGGGGIPASGAPRADRAGRARHDIAAAAPGSVDGGGGGDILRVEGLTRHFVKRGMFGSSGSVARAMDDISFRVGRGGDTLVLAGESGSGKSTVAKAVMGSVRADSGEVYFDGERVEYGSASGLRRIRMGCQMIHQDPYDSVNPRMRVGQIIEEPLEIHGWHGGSSAARSERAAEVLEEVGLSPAADIAARHPHMLSGGQRQRVVLARALALKPRVIIADEPVSMLDVSIRAEMLDLMGSLQRRHGMSFVYITHDLATARHFGKRIAVMYRGKIVEDGPIGDVLLRPRHPYTQALIDAIPEPDPANLGRERAVRIKESDEEPAAGECRFRPRCPYAIDACGGEPSLADAGGGRGVACHVDIRRQMPAPP